MSATNGKDSLLFTYLKRPSNRSFQSLVKDVLASGGDLNAEDETGATLLSVAVTTHRVNFVRTLIQAGAAVNKEGTDGKTPIFAAVFCNDFMITEELIRAGANVDVQSAETGQTPLFHAILYTNFEIIKLLIQQGSNGLFVTDQDFEETALHTAVRVGHLGIIKLLVEKGSDLYAATKNGLTPLSLAVLSGDMEIVEYLVGHGAIYDIQSALCIAVNVKNIEAVQFLGQRCADLASFGYDSTALDLAVSGGNIAIIEFLLRNFKGGNKPKWLVEAILKRNLAVVRSLVEFGVCVDSADDKNRKPLPVALKMRSFSIVKCLLDRGADTAAYKDDLEAYAKSSVAFAHYWSEFKSRSIDEQSIRGDNREGVNREGVNREGVNREGVNREDVNREGDNKEGDNREDNKEGDKP